MSKPKFKIGDKVRINRNARKNFVPEKYIGVEGEIVETTIEHFLVKVPKRGCPLMVAEKAIDLISPEKIIIYRNGSEVVAKNTATGKTGVARCNPADEFDFNTGAKLAFERLLREHHEFKVGDKIIGTAEASKHYSITVEGWRGTVTKVDGYWIEAQGELGGAKFDLDPKHFVLADRAKTEEAKPKYYSGKVVCVRPFSSFFTKGKVYEIKDGVAKDDEGDRMIHRPVKSFEEFSQKMISKFIELVE